MKEYNQNTTRCQHTSNKEDSKLGGGQRSSPKRPQWGREIHPGIPSCLHPGIHETFPKCLQRVRDACDKTAQNPSQGLHFNMLLGLGACPGMPWRPSRDGYPKKHKKITWKHPPFGAYL